ncbi:MAG: hypothetical protein HC938_00990, partial [Nitrospira sp.]|nr:hypothetical protein [Nitrospira sp.]
GDGEWGYVLFDTAMGKLVSVTELPDADHDHGVEASIQLSAVDISDDAEYVVRQAEHPSAVQIWDCAPVQYCQIFAATNVGTWGSASHCSNGRPPD